MSEERVKELMALLTCFKVILTDLQDAQLKHVLLKYCSMRLCQMPACAPSPGMSRGDDEAADGANDGTCWR